MLRKYRTPRPSLEGASQIFFEVQRRLKMHWRINAGPSLEVEIAFGVFRSRWVQSDEGTGML